MAVSSQTPESRKLDLLASQKQDLIRKLAGVNTELGIVNSKLKEIRRRTNEQRVMTDPKLVYAWESQQANLRRQKAAFESEVSRINDQRRMIQNQLNLQTLATKWKGDTEELLLLRLGELRGKYQQFAADSTRVNSMRLMASGFAKELTDVMRDIGLLADI